VAVSASSTRCGSCCSETQQRLIKYQYITAIIIVRLWRVVKQRHAVPVIAVKLSDG
jgi:hypothetical protein